MKKQIINGAISVAVLLPVVAYATDGYQLIGVGSYQKSLGGAVTANPGSAMTSVSNPAGAARIESRADFSMEAFMPERDVDFTALGGEKHSSEVELYGVPAIGWSAPTSAGSQLYFGGGMYGTSGMGVDYSQVGMMPGLKWDGYSNISFWQMAPLLAKNVNDKLSVGATLNIDYQSVAFKQRVMQGDTVLNNFDLSRSSSSFGFGFGVGLLYDVNDKITLGLNYKSKQNFSELKYQLAKGDITNRGTALPGGEYKLDLDFPQQLALGIAFKPTNRLTISSDIKWIDWSDTMGKLSVKGPGGLAVPMDPGWEDQTVYALGVAYKVNNKLNLRAGYNYASAPIDENKVSSNLILPALVESHYSVGGDYKINKHWDVGLHYMVAPNQTKTAPNNDLIAPGASSSLAETSFGANIGYRF
jgi:long-chain fatty acid transport protein